jgi:short-subunit dehydrogenase
MNAGEHELAHPLQGASVLLAGASGGLGCALAVELDRRGALLTLVGRSLERLQAVPVPGHRHAIDLSSSEGAARAVDAALAAAGHLDVLINAVGVVSFGKVKELSDGVLEELFRTNVFLPIYLAQAAIERIEPGGAIVNISGVITERQLPGMAAYGASKAALRGFDEALAREVRGMKVRVLDVRAPHTETGMAERPLEGLAPSMAEGASPDLVAEVICDALEKGARELGSEAFLTAP